MTRGKRPTTALEEAQSCAEKMGYRWMANTEPSLSFDLLIFKPESIRVVRVWQTRYHIDPNGFYDQMFPEEVNGLRSLPFPKFILRELWLRTRGERGWRRLVIHELSVEEIEWWRPDGYTNSHA
jgi:hypothetical protein